MHHAALHMGYRPTVRIIKTRRTASVGGCSLCIDEVEGETYDSLVHAAQDISA
jgi:adenylate cyclase class 2